MSHTPIPFAGELAALGTATCWSLCSLAFAFAGKRIGAMSVNQLRIPMAVVLLGSAHLLMFGEVWPSAAGASQIGWLALSGVIGLAVGDLFLFHCFVLIGPRIGHILMTTAPMMAALAAWPVLSETLDAWSIIGIVITVGGVMTVLGDRRGHNAWESPPGSRLTGVACGLLGAAGQACGLVIAKLGMLAGTGSDSSLVDGAVESGSLNPLSATLIRMVAATVGIWIIAGFRGQWGSALRSTRDLKAMKGCAIGATLGPFLGVWLSLVSVTYTKAGIGATLMATAPILMLPLARFAYGDRPGPTAVIGTFIAVLGVACLFLFGGS